MAWQQRIVRSIDTAAERVTNVEYFDGDDPATILHREIMKQPAGTSEEEVLEEAAHRGRSARSIRGRAKDPLEGRVEPIDRRA